MRTSAGASRPRPGRTATLRRCRSSGRSWPARPTPRRSPRRRPTRSWRPRSTPPPCSPSGSTARRSGPTCATSPAGSGSTPGRQRSSTASWALPSRDPRARAAPCAPPSSRSSAPPPGTGWTPTTPSMPSCRAGPSSPPVEQLQAENRKAAEDAFDRFVAKYEAKYDKAVACLAKDREVLLAFYDFPAEHWKHVRTTNPIESTFATVRLRTDKTKGCLSRQTALAMVYKLAKAAERSWRRLDGSQRLAQVIQGVRFRDGEPVQAAEEQVAA